jgi:hypothetical protein
VIFKVIDRQSDGRADEGAGEFGYEFFQGVARITKAGLAEVTVEAGFMAGSMGRLMGQSGPILASIAKGLVWGHLDVVGGFGIEGAIAAVSDSNGDASE